MLEQPTDTHIEVCPQPRTPEGAEASISFRPGPELGRAITTFASEAGLSRPESAKRLCAMALSGFCPFAHYGPLSRLATWRDARARADRGPRAAVGEAFVLVCRDLSAIRDRYQVQFGGRQLTDELVLQILEGTVAATERGERIQLDLQAP